VTLTENTYRGLHAQYYDLIYAEKPYDEEARFVVQLLERHGLAERRGLLDLACGTGRHAHEFAAMGFTVTGVDVNEQLLAHARERDAGQRASAEFVAQDMRQLDLDGRLFGTATCLFDSIGYAVTGEAVVATLQAVRSHLSPAGLLAIEFLHAPAMARYSDPLRLRRWTTPTDGELVRVSETQLEPERETHRVRYELLALEQEGTYTRGIEEHVVRSFDVDGMRLLLEEAGFSPLTFVAAYEADPAITDRTWHVLAVSQPA
jgi:SAM-dependent methyltransferase